MDWHWPYGNTKWIKKGTETWETLKSRYVEHTLTTEQLSDLFPLARIQADNVLASRGISQYEATLRLSETHRLGSRLSRPLLRRILPCLLLTSNQLLPLVHLLLLPFSALLWLLHFLTFSASPFYSLLISLFQLASFLVLVSLFLSNHYRLTVKFDRIFPFSCIADNFNVIREGTQLSIPDKEITLGDLIWLEPGQRLPADIRILQIVDCPLLADTSWLSFRSDPIEFSERAAPRHCDVFQARNVLFAGFSCTRGRALGIVVRTRGQTLLCRLSAPPPASPLRQQWPLPSAADQSSSSSCRTLSFVLLFLLLLLSLFLLFGALLSPTDSSFSFLLSIFLVLATAILPHGLPLAWSAQLMLTLSRLKGRACGRMLLRDKRVADTLGRTTALLVHSSAVLFPPKMRSLTDLWLAGSNQHILATQMLDWALCLRAKGKQHSLEIDQLGHQFGPGAVELLKMAAAFSKGKDEDNIQKTGIDTEEGGRNGKESNKNSIWNFFRPKDKVFSAQQCAEVPISISKKTKCKSTLSAVNLAGESAAGNTGREGGIDAALTKFLAELGLSANCLRPRVQLDQPFPAHSDWRTPHLALVHCAGLPAEGRGEGQPAGQRLLLRGAPEQLLLNCSTVRVFEGGGDGEGTGTAGELPLDERALTQFQELFLHLSAQGKCCLGFAVSDIRQPSPPSCYASSRSSDSWNGDDSGWADSTSLDHPNLLALGRWCFLGLIALADSQQPVNYAAQFQRMDKMGIRTVLIMDEHPALAQAKAKQSGLPMDTNRGKGRDRIRQKTSWPSRHLLRPLPLFPHPLKKTTHSGSNSSGYQSEPKSVPPAYECAGLALDPDWPIDGDAMAELDPGQLNALLADPRRLHLLFTRLGQAQILQVVEGLQSLGHTVAFVVQNGLQDGMVMRQADLAIARVRSKVPGSLLAQRAAHILCADVRLPNLVSALAEARQLPANLTSMLAFSLSHCLPLLSLSLLTVLFGFKLNSLQQVLAIVFLLSLPPTVALAFNRTSTSAAGNVTVFGRGKSPSSAPKTNISLLLYGLLASGIPLTLGCFLAFATVFWREGLGILDMAMDKQPDEHYLWENGNSTSGSTDLVHYQHQHLIVINGQASSAWLLTLVVAQMFHVWICAEMTGGMGIFRNIPLWAALLFDLCLLHLLFYQSHLLDATFGVDSLLPPPLIIWAFPLGLGLFLIALNQIYFWTIRHR